MSEVQDTDSAILFRFVHVGIFTIRVEAEISKEEARQTNRQTKRHTDTGAGGRADSKQMYRQIGVIIKKKGIFPYETKKNVSL